MPKSQIVLLTGKRQVGKSTLCKRLVKLIQQDGDLTISGVLTQRTGPHDLDVVEIASGDKYPLTLPFQPSRSGSYALAHFQMDPQAMARSAQALERSFPTQVFMLDEIGPLELVRGQGWARALTLLNRSDYNAAFVVVRPELLLKAILQLPKPTYTVVEVTLENRDRLPAELLRVAQKLCEPEPEI